MKSQSDDSLKGDLLECIVECEEEDEYADGKSPFTACADQMGRIALKKDMV